MLLNEALGFGDLRRFQTVVGVKDHIGLNPELRLTNGMLNMHMRPRFLAREEVEPVAAYSQDRRTHGHQNSAARMGDGQPSTAVGNGFEVGGRQSRRIPLDLPGATGDVGSGSPHGTTSATGFPAKRRTRPVFTGDCRRTTSTRFRPVLDYAPVRLLEIAVRGST